MRWTYANSRAALSLRRRLGRYGIGTPRVAVRTHVPMHWRLLGIGLLLSVSLAAAAWIYDAGRRFAGFDPDGTQQELAALRSRVAELETDLTGLRAVADASTSSLQIERTAQQQLARKVKALEEENGRLKQDLAFFESLADTKGKETGLTINRLEIEPDAVPGQYRYRLLAVLQGGKSREFNGTIQLVVSLSGPGAPSTIVLPQPDEADKQRFQLSFRHFRRIDGLFKLPEGAKATAVEVRLIQDGSTMAAQSLKL